MTLHQFRIFSAIAKTGNLTKAALGLRTSQPAISHQMKLLQDSYGATVYIRTPFGIALTPAGERLLVGIGPILEMVGKLKTDPTLAVAPKAGREVLRVGAFTARCLGAIPRRPSECRA